MRSFSDKWLFNVFWQDTGGETGATGGQGGGGGQGGVTGTAGTAGGVGGVGGADGTGGGGAGGWGYGNSVANAVANALGVTAAPPGVGSVTFGTNPSVNNSQVSLSPGDPVGPDTGQRGGAGGGTNALGGGGQGPGYGSAYGQAVMNAIAHAIFGGPAQAGDFGQSNAQFGQQHALINPNAVVTYLNNALAQKRGGVASSPAANAGITGFPDTLMTPAIKAMLASKGVGTVGGVAGSPPGGPRAGPPPGFMHPAQIADLQAALANQAAQSQATLAGLTPGQQANLAALGWPATHPTLGSQGPQGTPAPAQANPASIYGGNNVGNVSALANPANMPSPYAQAVDLMPGSENALYGNPQGYPTPFGETPYGGAVTGLYGNPANYGSTLGVTPYGDTTPGTPANVANVASPVRGVVGQPVGQPSATVAAPPSAVGQPAPTSIASMMAQNIASQGGGLNVGGMRSGMVGGAFGR